MSVGSATAWRADPADDEAVCLLSRLHARLSKDGAGDGGEGERERGLSFLRDFAVFSVFKRTAENPVYKLEKHPKLRLKQGQYVLIGIDGQILKRGNDLRQVLLTLERALIRIVD